MSRVLDWDYQWGLLTSHRRYAAATWKPTPGQEGGRRLVTLPDVPLPPGWTHATATMAFDVPSYFPCVPPQGFWTKEEVRLAGRGLPQWTRTGYRDQPVPPGFAWFWLHGPRTWSVNGDTLLTYAHFVRMRFQTLR